MGLMVVAAGDRATMRKAHPCGSYDWLVVATGADIRMECSKCGRRIMLAREEFERRVRRIEPVNAIAKPKAAPEGSKEGAC